MISRNSKTPLHTQLREHLIADFKNFNDGEMLPTEFALAEKFKVSRLTVHKVMNELQRDGFIIRRAGRGSFVSHGDRRVHTGEMRAEKGSILMAYPEWFSFDFWTKRQRARQLAHANSMSVTDYMITPETMYGGLGRLIEKSTDVKGVIIVPPGGPIAPEAVQQFESFEIPVVLLSANAVLPEDIANVYTVVQNYHRIGYLDITTLCEMGHRKIAYIASEPWDETYRLELEGMKQALRDLGLPRKTLWHPQRHARPWELASDVAYQIARDLMPGFAPTAMIFDSVPDAMGGMRAAWESPNIDAERMEVVINAPWFGAERSLWPPPTMVTGDVVRNVDKAFEIILGRCEPDSRMIIVEDVRVENLKEI